MSGLGCHVKGIKHAAMGSILNTRFHAHAVKPTSRLQMVELRSIRTRHCDVRQALSAREFEFRSSLCMYVQPCMNHGEPRD